MSILDHAKSEPVGDHEELVDDEDDGDDEVPGQSCSITADSAELAVVLQYSTPQLGSCRHGVYVGNILIECVTVIKKVLKVYKDFIICN